MNTNKIATGSVNRKLLAALAVLAVAFVVLAAVPAVATDSDAAAGDGKDLKDGFVAAYLVNDQSQVAGAKSVIGFVKEGDYYLGVAFHNTAKFTTLNVTYEYTSDNKTVTEKDSIKYGVEPGNWKLLMKLADNEASNSKLSTDINEISELKVTLQFDDSTATYTQTLNAGNIYIYQDLDLTGAATLAKGTTLTVASGATLTVANGTNTDVGGSLTISEGANVIVNGTLHSGAIAKKDTEDNKDHVHGNVEGAFTVNKDGVFQDGTAVFTSQKDGSSVTIEADSTAKTSVTTLKGAYVLTAGTYKIELKNFSENNSITKYERSLVVDKDSTLTVSKDAGIEIRQKGAGITNNGVLDVNGTFTIGNIAKKQTKTYFSGNAIVLNAGSKLTEMSGNGSITLGDDAAATISVSDNKRVIEFTEGTSTVSDKFQVKGQDSIPETLSVATGATIVVSSGAELHITDVGELDVAGTISVENASDIPAGIKYVAGSVFSIAGTDYTVMETSVDGEKYQYALAVAPLIYKKMAYTTDDNAIQAQIYNIDSRVTSVSVLGSKLLKNVTEIGTYENAAQVTFAIGVENKSVQRTVNTDVKVVAYDVSNYVEDLTKWIGGSEKMGAIVPGGEISYAQLGGVSDAIYNAYVAVNAAISDDEAQKAVDDGEAAILKALQSRLVEFLDVVYNNGDDYYGKILLKDDYEQAVEDVNAATVADGSEEAIKVYEAALDSRGNLDDAKTAAAADLTVWLAEQLGTAVPGASGYPDVTQLDDGTWNTYAWLGGVYDAEYAAYNAIYSAAKGSEVNTALENGEASILKALQSRLVEFLGVLYNNGAAYSAGDETVGHVLTKTEYDASVAAVNAAATPLKAIGIYEDAINGRILFKTVNITWIVDDESIVTQAVAGYVPYYPYGALPDGYSWFPALYEVTGDATFRAQLSATVTFGDEITVLDGTTAIKSGDKVPVGDTLTVTAKAQEGKVATIAPALTNGTYKLDGDVEFTVSYADPAYAITVGTYIGGTVTVDKTSAVEGETVTLTVTPDSGYQTKAVSYNGTAITVAADGSYSFKMPAADVTISVEFEQSATPVGPVAATKVTVSITADNQVFIYGNDGYVPAGTVTVLAFYKATTGGVLYTPIHLTVNNVAQERGVFVEIPAPSTGGVALSSYIAGTASYASTVGSVSAVSGLTALHFASSTATENVAATTEE